MEFIGGDGVYLWKTHLLAESPGADEASQVGTLIGKVHAASVKADFNTSAFQNRDDFHALRLEPYLTYTATLHPDISTRLNEIADNLYQSKQVLVHGDVSPKNILFRPTGPVILDAECATMGDASFDPSFCLNHLILKAIHLPASRQRYLQNALKFWRSYETAIDWEPRSAVESRICELLPALMLARVDGKSPVEYLSKEEGDIVRTISRRFIKSPETQLTSLLQGIDNALKELQA
jgi:aminoglycoside phosphotransferase (APT) family kinase protein